MSERDRDRETETETQRERERKTETERERGGRERDRDTEREGELRGEREVVLFVCMHGVVFYAYWQFTYSPDTCLFGSIF